MPTYQQKVHVERHMNGHWDRLAAQKAVVDSHWKPGESPNCMPRQEHHVLRSRRLQRENMKLYNKLYGISTTNAVSATAQHIANHTRDPDEAELLNQQREWQRKHDRQQKQANVDRENLKIFHTITNAKSLVQSADSMAREYRERQLLLVHENDVKDTDLHLHIRRHHPNHHTLLASPVSSREKHSLSPCISPIKLPSSGRSRSRGGSSSSSSRRRRPEVDLSSPVLEGRMPGKMRGLMRSNSAHNTRKGRSSKGHGSRRSASNSSWKKSSRVKNEEHDDWEDDVERVYKILAERAALRVTPEDMDTYTSEENWEDGFENHVSREESEEDDDDDVAPLQRVLFSDTATDTLLSSPCEIPQNSNTKEADEPSTPPWRVGSEQYDTPHLPGLCRRNLFYHTSLQAHVHMIVSSHDHSDDHSNDDSAPQPDAVFAVKMYDVGESCDARMFKGKAAGDTRSERGGRAWANESCDGECAVVCRACTVRKELTVI